jgi:hypothetical protein
MEIECDSISFAPFSKRAVIQKSTECGFFEQLIADEKPRNISQIKIGSICSRFKKYELWEASPLA